MEWLVEITKIPGLRSSVLTRLGGTAIGIRCRLRVRICRICRLRGSVGRVVSSNRLRLAVTSVRIRPGLGVSWMRWWMLAIGLV